MGTVDIQPALNFINGITPQQAIFIVSIAGLSLAAFALFVVMRVVSTLATGKKK